MTNISISASSSSVSLPSSKLWILFLASLGGALEYYDFVIFVFFTPLIGQLFFPASTPDWLRQIQVYGIFAAGYLARPMGGLLMAHFGDLRGRKRMFTASVLLMAIPTLAIGLMPTYQSIGILAPLLLLILRILQGLAIGGDIPAGTVFAAEHVSKNTGLAIGLFNAGFNGGVVLGSLVTTIVSVVLSPAEIADGGWRLPFLIGGAFGFTAMLLRSYLDETPVFEEMKRRAAILKKAPLSVVVRDHRPALLASMCSAWMLGAGVIVILLMTPTLFQRIFHLSVRKTQFANLVGSALASVSLIVVGALIDRFGLRRVAVSALLLFIAATYGLYLGVEHMPSGLLWFYMAAGLAAGAVTTAPVTIIRAFPPQVRLTGFAFSYNIIIAFSSGISTLLVSSLAPFHPTFPAHYIAVVTLVAIVAITLAPVARSDY
jgi:MFS family permease